MRTENNGESSGLLLKVINAQAISALMVDNTIAGVNDIKAWIQPKESGGRLTVSIGEYDGAHSEHEEESLSLNEHHTEPGAQGCKLVDFLDGLEKHFGVKKTAICEDAVWLWPVGQIR